MTGIQEHPLFEQYTNTYSSRLPDLSRVQNQDELRLLTESDDVREMEFSPAVDFETGIPPQERSDDGLNKYLWVVRAQNVPRILESGPAGRSLTRGRVAHTNLTAGEAAYCGGELWFRDTRSFWMSGGSGRYPPRSSDELEFMVKLLTGCGYSVCSFGWDQEVNGPARFLRGEGSWT
jgi:hypothetical protein